MQPHGARGVPHANKGALSIRAHGREIVRLPQREHGAHEVRTGEQAVARQRVADQRVRARLIEAVERTLGSDDRARRYQRTGLVPQSIKADRDIAEQQAFHQCRHRVAKRRCVKRGLLRSYRGRLTHEVERRRKCCGASVRGGRR
jgi:hypothetical protein